MAATVSSPAPTPTTKAANEPQASVKTGQPGVSQPRFVIEVAPNVQGLTFAVALGDLRVTSTNSNNDINTNVATNNADIVQGLLLTPDQVVVANHVFRFPVAIDPRSLQQHVHAGDLVLRLQLKHVPGERASTALRNKHYDVTPLLHVSFLAHADRLACAGCSAALTTGFDRCRALPSSCWHEMVECWACHEQQIIMPSGGHLVAEPGTCLVGPTVLLVHPTQIHADQIRWAEPAAGAAQSAALLADGGMTVRAAPPAVVHCTTCGTMIGFAHARNDLTKGIRLFKTNLLAAQGTVTWNRHKVVQTALMAELLDHVTSHATHRAVVADLSRDGRATAMIWVLNWNCRVRTRTAASSRALKVLFRELEDGPDAGRLASDSTGTVVVPDSQPLLELLRVINTSLPPSQAQHEIQGEQWKVAYLMQ
ncbi:hypothetical protein GGF31_007170 [Allomyces arbusculus]|nr:hypothetical protein GGF31_007170 [Allomyces arbusculus]